MGQLRSQRRHYGEARLIATLVSLASGWTPGIGDPTPLGWATVIAYFVAALLAVLAARRPRPDRRFWSAVALLLIALGINKQLDLQSLLTTVGRNLAHAQHWYDQRRTYQMLFIALFIALCLVIVLLLWRRTRRASEPVRAAMIGVVVLLGFIAVRAASFDHFDTLLMDRIGGWRLNWLLELGGIALIGLPAAVAASSAPRGARTRRRR